MDSKPNNCQHCGSIQVLSRSDPHLTQKWLRQNFDWRLHETHQNDFKWIHKDPTMLRTIRMAHLSSNHWAKNDSYWSKMLSRDYKELEKKQKAMIVRNLTNLSYA